MTRWAMLADLERCVGCQTCTAACRHANATSPAVQWRKVLDIEAGAFPNVNRTFVPVGCQHCADPPRRHRHHRLRPVHRLRLLRRRLSLPSALFGA
jgi:Fe-S-cluster-containing dehydrogenase component